MPINKTWPECNKMPRNATEAQRIKWHLEHAKECACRPIPPPLLAKVNQQKGAG